MSSDDLSDAFRKRYHNAESGYAVVSIHLFGIEFAAELEGKNLKEICLSAEVPVSFATEVRKGMRLAEFVAIK